MISPKAIVSCGSIPVLSSTDTAIPDYVHQVQTAKVRKAVARTGNAAAAGTIAPETFHVENWRLVRDGAPVFCSRMAAGGDAAEAVSGRARRCGGRRSGGRPPPW